MTSTAQSPTNSRASLAGAGWHCEAQHLTCLLPEATRDKPPFNWLRPSTLLGARNDVLARGLGDPSHQLREAWLQRLYPSGARTLEMRPAGTDDSTSFLVIGDTGEGDTSQYAVIETLKRASAGTDFMVICSDVIYPAGGLREYAYKFLRPYDFYPKPIYALPGNHDWYDGLLGFMRFFCHVTGPTPTLQGSSLKLRLRNLLWRKRTDEATPDQQSMLDSLRMEPNQQSTLPGPYYVIRTGPVDLVTIDTGIDGRIDAAQAAWLRQVSRSAKPKILLTGKPIYVDGDYHPCFVHDPDDSGDWDGATVDQIVRDPECNYIAAVGGDVHNYQRYPVEVGDRVIQYIVSGGGGAFMHPTHKIPNIDTCDLAGVTEADFRCFPLRGDSLAFYSRVLEKKLHKRAGSLAIDPVQAALYMGRRLGLPPTKKDIPLVSVAAETRAKAAKVFPLPGRPKGPWHMVYSEFLDWNTPPLFKSFLRLDADRGSVTVTCWGASGCTSDADRGPEDSMTYDVATRRWSYPNVG